MGRRLRGRITAALKHGFSCGTFICSLAALTHIPAGSRLRPSGPLALHRDAEHLIRERMQDVAREEAVFHEPNSYRNVRRLNIGVLPSCDVLVGCSPGPDLGSCGCQN